MSLLPEHLTRMKFLLTILRPLIDTYMRSAYSLQYINGSICEQEFIQEVLNKMKIDLNDGVINYGELYIKPQNWNLM